MSAPTTCLGGEAERVVVATGRVVQQHGRVGEVAGGARRGLLSLIAVQDRGENVGRGGREQRLGLDDVVRVAVAGGHQVDVVRGAAAGHRDVEQLAALLAGGEGVAGVGGDALRAVHGGRVAQFGVLAHVAGGQRDGAVRVQVHHHQRAGALHLRHGPPVAVFHPVGAADRQCPVVEPGDDRVAGAGTVPVGERTPRGRSARRRRAGRCGPGR